MEKVSSTSMKIHYATKLREEGIGHMYKLLCSGNEVYIPYLVGRWALVLPTRTVTCKKCLKKSAEMKKDE